MRTGPATVSPLVPSIRFRTPTIGGSAPPERSTLQMPSKSATRVAFHFVPGENVPFPPMEAELVSELPEGDGWQYEPKWDGFRGVLENDGGELALWSRKERPLLRYFPELRPLGDLLPPHSALDGEIVIARDGVLDFELMQTRLHPAESRVNKLAAEIPAEFIAFDVLLWKGKPLHELPLAKRRKELEKLAKGFRLSPATQDVETARGWLDTFEAAGLDGVIAKRLDLAVPARAARRGDEGEAATRRRTASSSACAGSRSLTGSRRSCSGSTGRTARWTTSAQPRSPPRSTIRSNSSSRRSST